MKTVVNGAGTKATAAAPNPQAGKANPTAKPAPAPRGTAEQIKKGPGNVANMLSTMKEEFERLIAFFKDLAQAAKQEDQEKEGTSAFDLKTTIEYLLNKTRN